MPWDVKRMTQKCLRDTHGSFHFRRSDRVAESPVAKFDSVQLRRQSLMLKGSPFLISNTLAEKEQHSPERAKSNLCSRSTLRLNNTQGKANHVGMYDQVYAPTKSLERTNLQPDSERRLRKDGSKP